MGQIGDWSIKPFVGRIEFREHDDEHFHPSHSSVANSRPDQNAQAGVNGDEVFAELHLSAFATFEEEIRFCQVFVVMESRLGRDFGHVDRARKIGPIGQCPTRLPTRTRYWLNLIEIDNFIQFRGLVQRFLSEILQECWLYCCCRQWPPPISSNPS